MDVVEHSSQAVPISARSAKTGMVLMEDETLLDAFHKVLPLISPIGNNMCLNSMSVFAEA